MSYHFKNLVFEGGGVKGIAYVGAMEVLDREGILNNIERASISIISWTNRAFSWPIPRGC